METLSYLHLFILTFEPFVCGAERKRGYVHMVRVSSESCSIVVCLYLFHLGLYIKRCVCVRFLFSFLNLGGSC
jgi:hypothetical protein